MTRGLEARPAGHLDLNEAVVSGVLPTPSSTLHNCTPRWLLVGSSSAAGGRIAGRQASIVHNSSPYNSRLIGLGMADRDWLRIYEVTKRQIISKRQAGHGIDSSETRSLNETLSRLDAQLKDMMASPMEYEIPASELARRQSLIENLQKQMAIVPTGVGGGNGSNAAGVMNPMAHSDRGLMQRQQDVIRLQDDMISDIGQGNLSSLHMWYTIETMK